MTLKKELNIHFEEIARKEGIERKQRNDKGVKRKPYNTKKRKANGNDPVNNGNTDNNFDSLHSEFAQKTAESIEVEKEETVIQDSGTESSREGNREIGENKSVNERQADNQFETVSGDDSDLLNTIIEENKSAGEFKEVENKNKPQKENVYVPKNHSEGVKRLINGRILLRFCDVIFPTLIIKIGSIFEKDLRQLKKSDLKLTPDQIDDMIPIANEVAHLIFEHIDPMTAFIIMMGINYMSNAGFALEMKRREPDFVSLNKPKVIPFKPNKNE